MAKATFKLNGKLAIFVAIFLPLTVTLGFWQLDRASQKEQLIAKHEALVTEKPFTIETVEGLTLPDYQPVKAEGTFLNDVFLLDNQILSGKVGYEVLQPFRLNNGHIIFVSRGFTVGDVDRRILPNIKTPQFVVNITGYIYQPKINPLVHENVQTYSVTWPVRVQSLLVENLYNHWAKSGRINPPFLESSIVRLEADSAYIFDAHWMLVNNTPDKHIAYAVQWFGMAGLLFVLFLWSSFSSKQSSDKADSK